MRNHIMKDSIAIYCQHYLTISMTFIYRQLHGISSKYEPIVLTTKTENENIFPFEKLYLLKKSFFDKVYVKFSRKIFNKYAVLANSQINYSSKILRDENIKLIHAHFGPSALEIFPIAKKLNIPLLVTFHGYDASSELNKKKYVIELKRLFSFSSIITVSEKMAKDLVKLGANPQKTFVHYIGVPLGDFSFQKRVPIKEKVSQDKQIIFLQVSNFVEKKGHKYTVEAFKELLVNHPNSKLILAGDGPLKEETIRLCEQMGISNNVNFIDRVTKREIVPLMQDADIFLHHSVTAKNGDQEGIPTVLMEAMAMGLVVISTYHAGIPELIQDEENGYLVEERNIKQYTEKMIKSLDSNEAIIENAVNQIYKNFNLDKQNNKLMEIYNEVIDCKE